VVFPAAGRLHVFVVDPGRRGSPAEMDRLSRAVLVAPADVLARNIRATPAHSKIARGAMCSSGMASPTTRMRTRTPARPLRPDEAARAWFAPIPPSNVKIERHRRRARATRRSAVSGRDRRARLQFSARADTLVLAEAAPRRGTKCDLVRGTRPVPAHIARAYDSSAPGWPRYFRHPRRQPLT